MSEEPASKRSGAAGPARWREGIQGARGAWRGSGMKREESRRGMTLIEILVVITIIGILASIMVPVAGKAKKTAQKRRAQAEMQGIKVAVLQFQADHRYMPWPPERRGAMDVQVGADMWAVDEATQVPVMELLTGNNPLKKIYLQIPEKSRRLKAQPDEDPLPMRFVDPWGQHYVIGLDRNLDGAVTVANTDVAWNGKTVMEKVLVYSPGPPGEAEPLKTFDVP